MQAVPLSVLGYTKDIDSPEIDPDVNFRRALRILNSIPGALTVSSCQGHRPGTQYADVRVVMMPYITVYGDAVSLRYIKAAVKKCPFLDRVDGEPPKILVKFTEEAIDRWGKIADFLTKKSVAYAYG